MAAPMLNITNIRKVKEVALASAELQTQDHRLEQVMGNKISSQTVRKLMAVELELETLC